MTESMTAVFAGLSFISTGVAVIATFVAIAAARSSWTQARKARRSVPAPRPPRVQAAQRPKLADFDVAS